MIKRSQNPWVAHQNITEKGEINLLCFVFAGGDAQLFCSLEKELSRMGEPDTHLISSEGEAGR